MDVGGKCGVFWGMVLWSSFCCAEGISSKMGYGLELGSFSQEKKAIRLAQKYKKSFSKPVLIDADKGHFLIKVGPFKDREEARSFWQYHVGGFWSSPHFVSMPLSPLRTKAPLKPVTHKAQKESYTKYFLQIASYKSENSAKALAENLIELLNITAVVENSHQSYLVLLGPFASKSGAEPFMKQQSIKHYHPSLVVRYPKGKKGAASKKILSSEKRGKRLISQLSQVSHQKPLAKNTSEKHSVLKKTSAQLNHLVADAKAVSMITDIQSHSSIMDVSPRVSEKENTQQKQVTKKKNKLEPLLVAKPPSFMSRLENKLLSLVWKKTLTPTSEQTDKKADNKNISGNPLPVKWLLENADINDVIEKVAQATGKNFIADSRLEGRLSLISGRLLTADELYQIFLTLLDGAGYATVPVGDVIKIVPKSSKNMKKNQSLESGLKEKTSKLTVLHNGSYRIGNQIQIPDNPQLTQALKELNSQEGKGFSGKANIYAPSNIIVLSGNPNAPLPMNNHRPYASTQWHSKSGYDQHEKDITSLHWDSSACGFDGPFKLGADYSKVFGLSAKASYQQQVSPETAVYGVVDVGSKQNRESLTAGFIFNHDFRSKFTVERLQQTLPMNFHSGEVSLPVEQYGIGSELQVSLSNPVFRFFNVGANYVYGSDKDLSDITYVNEIGEVRLDHRRVSGIRQVGFNVGADFYFNEDAYINLSAGLENAHYYNQNMPGDSSNQLTFGIKGEKLILDRKAKIDFLASRHLFYDQLQSSIHWLKSLDNDSVMSFGLGVQHFVNRQILPNDTRVQAEVGLRWDDGNRNHSKSRHYQCLEPKLNSLLQWVSSPAVYSAVVLAKADEGNIHPDPVPDTNVVFTPNIITITANNSFLSTAAFTGSNLAFTFEVTLDGSTSAGKPEWLHYTVSGSGGAKTLTLYADNAPSVEVQTDYKIKVIATDQITGKRQSGLLFLHVVPRILTFSQVINQQVPTRFTLTSDTLPKGEYVVAPPTNLYDYAQFSVSAGGGGMIQGSFTYTVEDSASTLYGKSCAVVYSLNALGELEETAASSDDKLACDVTMVQGMNARAILNIHLQE